MPLSRLPWSEAAILVLLSLSSMACSGGPPEILKVEWVLESRPIAASSYESLSVFVDLRDPDGMEDIEALWILSDSGEFYWMLDASSWTKKSEGGDTWLGAADLALPDRKPLPRSSYRVVVADLAGARAVREFRLEETGHAKALPKLSIQGNVTTLESEWEENYILAFDAAGTLIRGAVMVGKTGKLDGLLGTNDASRTSAIAVYGHDPAIRQGAFSARVMAR